MKIPNQFPEHIKNKYSYLLQDKNVVKTSGEKKDNNGNGPKPPTDGRGGGDGNNGDDFGNDDKRSMSEYEKQALFGKFAMRALQDLLPYRAVENSGFMTEIVNIGMIKEILSLPGLPFYATFDLEKRSLHFCTDMDHKWLANDPEIALRLDDHEPLRYTPEPLNQMPFY